MTFVLAVLAARQPTVPAISATALSSTAIQVSLVTPSVEPVSGISFYILSVSTGGPFVPIQDVSPGAFPFTVSGLQPSTTYTFFVEAVNNSPNGDTSDASAQVSATTQATTTPTPSTPVITATTVSSGSISIALTTPSTEPINGIKNYVLLRSVGGSPFNQLTTLTPSQWPFVDTGLSASTAYSYQTFAVDNSSAATQSANSATTTATTQAASQSTLGIKIFNSKFVNLQGTVTPLVCELFSGTMTLQNNFRVSSIAAITPAQWAAGVAAWGPAGGFTKFSLVNAMRIGILTSYWLGVSGINPSQGNGGWYTGSASGTGSPNMSASQYQGYIQEIVANLTAAGIYTVLCPFCDSMIAANGTRYLSIGQSGFPGPDCLAFWQSAAPLFANNPAVIFDLFNEPFGSDCFNSATGGGQTVGWYGTGAANTLGPDQLFYINAVTNSSTTSLYTQPGSASISTSQGMAANTPTGYLMMDNNNDDSLYSPNSSVQAKVCGLNQLLSVVGGLAPNVMLASLPGFSGGIDVCLLAAQQHGVTDPRGTGQMAFAWHTYGQGHFSTVATLNAAGFPVFMTEGDGGDFTKVGCTYNGFYNAGQGYTFANSWVSWGASASNPGAALTSMQTTEPWSAQSMPQPTGSN
jgi:hypothetical protein